MKLPTYSDGSSGRELIYPGAVLTKDQALRWAQRNMPKDLKRAGFKAGVFESDPVIHGSHYYRIGYGKAVAI